MHSDPTLPVFIIGVLVGVAVVLLAGRIPDIMFLARYMAARRGARAQTGRRYFLS